MTEKQIPKRRIHDYSLDNINVRRIIAIEIVLILPSEVNKISYNRFAV
jgi:hypothetical protein